MILSILLRTRNSGNELGKFEARVREGCELVLVDHLSSDDTVEIGRRMGAKIVVYEQQAFSFGAAINQGVPVCTGDWVLVASPHFIPMHADFWTRLRLDLKELPEDVLVCQGVGYLTEKQAFPPSGVTFFEAADLARVPWRIHGNSCCAYRRSALERFPFDESLESAEDAEWCLRVVRAGFRVAVDHRLPYLYRNRAPFKRYWHRGRVDFPAMSEVLGISSLPGLSSQALCMVKDFGYLVLGRIPPWLWLRLVVKRLAEASLYFFPHRQRETRVLSEGGNASQ